MNKEAMFMGNKASSAVSVAGALLLLCQFVSFWVHPPKKYYCVR